LKTRGCCGKYNVALVPGESAVSIKLSVLLLVLLVSVGVAAQSEKTRVTGDPLEEPEQSRDADINIPAEMRSRLNIERAEDEHRKLVDDVKKMNDLSGELVSRYKHHHKLSDDDIKRINSIEKLAKRVLNRSLGKEERPDDLPQFSMGVVQLGSATQKIQKVVAAETRFVVSATVIGTSNEVICLTEYIRQLQKRGE
jgi:hypothetical protein